MAEWTKAWLLQRLGMAADYVPQTQAEEDDFVERAIDLLRAPKSTRFPRYVRPAGSNRKRIRIRSGVSVATV